MRPAGGIRLLLVIPSLAGGGAEMVFATLADHWARTGHDVRVVTLGPRRKDVQALPAGTPRYELGRGRARWYRLGSQLRRVRELRRIMRELEPEVVVSFLVKANVLTVLAAARLPVRVVLAERSSLRRRTSAVTWLMRRVTYGRADAVTVLTRAAADCMARIVPRDRIAVVPNPLRLSAVRAPAVASRGADRERPRRVVSVGRLHPVKGMDLLLRAFAGAAAARPGWELVICGDGPEAQRLRDLAAELGVSERLKLPGRVEDIVKVLRESDLFVAASRYESFSNALVEAMSCGLPVISTACDGPSEIVTDGTDGMLVPTGNVEALSAGMALLMDSPAERARLGARAARTVSRYHPETVFAQWDSLLERVASAAR